MKKIYLFLLVVFCFLFCSCESTEVELPEGFSPIQQNPNISVKYDVLSGYELYIHKNQFKGFYPAIIQIGKNAENTYLGLTLRYSGNDWIFFNSGTFANFDERISFKVNRLNKNEDLKNGHINESIIMGIDESDAIKLLNIFNSNEVYLRLGGKHSIDYNLDADCIIAIKEMLEYYFSMQK